MVAGRRALYVPAALPGWLQYELSAGRFHRRGVARKRRERNDPNQECPPWFTTERKASSMTIMIGIDPHKPGSRIVRKHRTRSSCPPGRARHPCSTSRQLRRCRRTGGQATLSDRLLGRARHRAQNELFVVPRSVSPGIHHTHREVTPQLGSSAGTNPAGDRGRSVR